MLRLIHIFVVMLLLLVGCNTTQEEEAPSDPLALLVKAATKIRTSDTFKLYVEQKGAPALIALDMGQVQLSLSNVQYVAPNQLHADSKVLLGGLAVEVQIFASGTDQWYKIPPGGWIKGEFAPGFNPATLIAEDSGFQAALTALQSLEYVGAETLEDGSPVYHLHGIANGPDVSALVVGLIRSEGTIPVDVYVHRETGFPVRMILTQPEIVNDEGEPAQWVIDVFDIGVPATITPPEE